MTAKSRRQPRAFRPMAAPTGATIEVVGHSTAEEAEFIVCLRLADSEESLPFRPSNRIGRCIKRDERVISRAKALKKPKRLCMHCYVTDAINDAENPDAEPRRMIVTRTSLDEVSEAIHHKSLAPIAIPRKDTIE